MKLLPPLLRHCSASPPAPAFQSHSGSRRRNTARYSYSYPPKLTSTDRFLLLEGLGGCHKGRFHRNPSRGRGQHQSKTVLLHHRNFPDIVMSPAPRIFRLYSEFYNSILIRSYRSLCRGELLWKEFEWDDLVERFHPFYNLIRCNQIIFVIRILVCGIHRMD